MLALLSVRELLFTAGIIVGGISAVILFDRCVMRRECPRCGKRAQAESSGSGTARLLFCTNCRFQMWEDPTQPGAVSQEPWTER